MEKRIFERTIDQLVAINYTGRISYHTYNEPLLRKDLAELVAHVRQHLPQSCQMLFSNGDLLTKDIHGELIQAGLDWLYVTSHDNKPFPAMEKTVFKMARDLTLTNRGGALARVAQLDEPLQRPCFAPSDMLIITATGDILLCCDDFYRTTQMGNIMVRSIPEIWFSEPFIRLRENLRKGRRDQAAPICRACSNTEYYRPGYNYQLDLERGVQP
jgi:2-deoxy-scyllo-inosamine dehydrogenase (SAM-dependent)